MLECEIQSINQSFRHSHTHTHTHIHMRIYLIGFMGAGKSFFGKKLAAAFDFDFIDLDERIEKGEAKNYFCYF